MFLLFAVAAGLMLVADGPVRPLWLQYLLLGVVPLLAGITARWVSTRMMSRRSGRE